MTNFLLVSATVTTSTIDALPIITPNDVSIARNLFARSASIDTDSVSFKSIMKFYSPCFYLLESPEAHMKEKTRAAWFRALTSILLDPLERLAGAFVFRIQLQRRLIFFSRRFLLSLVLIQAPQPLVRHRISRITRTLRRLLQIFPQQPLGLFPLFVLQDQTHGPVKHDTRVRCGHLGSKISNFHQSIRLAAPHRVIANIENEFRCLRMTLQRQLELRIGIREIFFLPPTISQRVMPFRRIHGLQFLDLRLGFLLPAADHAGSRTIKFNQRLPRRKILFVELHRNLKFPVRLPRQPRCRKHRGMVRLLPVSPPEPFVKYRTFRIDGHRSFRARDGRIQIG